jgi:hypothetical protein
MGHSPQPGTDPYRARAARGVREAQTKPQGIDWAPNDGHVDRQRCAPTARIDEKLTLRSHDAPPSLPKDIIRDKSDLHVATADSSKRATASNIVSHQGIPLMHRAAWLGDNLLDQRDNRLSHIRVADATECQGQRDAI